MWKMTEKDKQNLKQLEINKSYILIDNRRRFYQEIRIIRFETCFHCQVVGQTHSLYSLKKRTCHSIEEIEYKINKYIFWKNAWQTK